MRTSLLALFLLPTIAMAAEPLHHQGRLLDAAGGPINGVRAVEFSLTSEAGTTLWTDTLTVRLDDGYYSVELGGSATNEIPDSALAADPWLDIAVDGSPLQSRMRLGAVPMARAARNVVGGTVDASEIRVDGQQIVDTDGRITGAITTESLRGLGCGTDELVLRGPGGWSCVPMDVFVPSNQSCPSGQKVTGVSTDGVITCAPDIDTNTNTTYDGGDFALSNRFCGADQFMNGINSNGTPRCSTLDSAVNSYIRNHCWIHFGWRDSIDGGNSAPSKYGRVQVSNGTGTPGCASTGTDNDCLQYTLHGQNTRLFAVNTDGTVNDDDKFYIGMYCIP